LFLGRVSFSASGTNRKEKEMATYMFFADYLEECRGWHCSMCTIAAYTFTDGFSSTAVSYWD